MWIVDETLGREEWKCWMRDLWVRIEWIESAEMKTGLAELGYESLEAIDERTEELG